MPQILTREFIESFYRARLSRDPAKIEPFLDDDVDWLISGPVELLQFCGQRRGKAEVLDTIVHQMPSVMNVRKVDLELLLIDGDRVATFSRLTGIQPSTSRTIIYNQAQFLQFRDGKIVEYRGIIDSFNAAEQMIGHPIEVAHMPREFTFKNLVAI